MKIYFLIFILNQSKIKNSNLKTKVLYPNVSDGKGTFLFFSK